MTGRSLLLLCALLAGPALAHVTPPVVLVSDRAAITSLLGGAKRYFVREVRLAPAEQESIEKETGWAPDEDFYRFYIGRDENQRDVGAVIFLTDYTMHGPVRVAVALRPDGKVKGARVAEVSEETYPWVKSLMDSDFFSTLAGHDAHSPFASGAGGGSMPRFYGDVITGLVRRAALLYEAGVLKHQHK
jgi:hypothetical protein